MTNKTKLSAAALFSALVLGGSFVGSTVFAAEPTDSSDPASTEVGSPSDPTATADPSDTTGTSDTSTTTKKGVDFDAGTPANETGYAYVGYTKNTPSPVEDPKDPKTPVTPVNPGDATGEVGVLTLDAIPSSLNFGTQEATAAGQVVNLLAHGDAKADPDATKGERANATGAKGEGKQTSDYTGSEGQVIFTQVTNAAGWDVKWDLSATMSEFSSDKGGSLPGAFITFGKGKNVVDTNTNGTRIWDDASDELSQGETLYAGSDAAKPEEGIHGADFVSSSQKGRFQQQWDVNSVTLTTPQAPAEGQYSATINWQLAATPATHTDDAAKE